MNLKACSGRKYNMYTISRIRQVVGSSKPSQVGSILVNRKQSISQSNYYRTLQDSVICIESYP